MQGVEFARSHNLCQALWKFQPSLGQIAFDRRSNFAERMEPGRELVKLLYDERIDDLRPSTTQIGDSAIEQAADLWIGSIRSRCLAKQIIRRVQPSRG